MRVALGIEYDGTAYYGWQIQRSPSLSTVQLAVESALSRIADAPVEVICAGRTDKGVHALGQVVHMDVAVSRSMSAWVSGTNRYLPPDIRVLWAKPVADAFHARYSAVARRYMYWIDTFPVRPALMRHRVTWHPFPLDTEKMQQAAVFLLGEHDFSAYRGADCQAKTPIRCITHLKIEQIAEKIVIDIQANAFLHHMVRNIVGVLLKIGEGKREPVWAREVLASRDRKMGAVTAPAEGLYLHSVSYPEELT